MSENPIDELHAVFDKYDQKQAEARNEAERKKTEHEIFLEDFRQKRIEVIRPTMEELGKTIESRGHKFVIKQQDEIKDREGRTTGANIEFAIYPEGKQPSYINRDFPHLSFVAETYGNKTWTHVSTMMPGRGGSAGKNRTYELSEITREVVQEEIVNLVLTCFGK